MPQSAYKKYRHDIHTGSHTPPPVAAQRDVDISCEKPGQRHVPTFPEIPDIDRLIGTVEVFRQMDSEQFPQADGNVTVAAEVKIQLHGIGNTGNPRLPDGKP